MAVDRPTFSENWYRVAELKPRLRATVQSYRQQYRGQFWHVLRDPSNNQFYRLSESAYHFVGLLNGQRTVADAWQITQEHLGDDAPTQPEVIQLLGQLYVSNMLQADLPGDTTALFERYRKRIRREVGGYMMNLLFARIPLFDPDWLLSQFVGVVSWLFTWFGLVLWVGLLAVGGFMLIGHGDRLLAQANPQQLLAFDNLILLYLCYAFIKIFHEFGHGFACKKFGRNQGSGGEVHVLGVMLLVLIPVPYVDASSAWALRSKWQRAVIGAAGIFVELGIAAIAAIIWVYSAPGTLLNALAYNTMFIASISTILFNGNPLLRFDGYYVLSDILEMPNLAQRSKDYLYYLTKKYAFGVRNPRDPSHRVSERPWLVVYGIAAAIYRVVIGIGIFMYVSEQFFIFGALLAASLVVTWAIVPLGKFVHYLVTNQELSRCRARATWVTVGTTAVIVGAIGFIPIPDYGYADAIVQPRQMVELHMRTAGFIEAVHDDHSEVEPGQTLVTANNPQLHATLRQLRADQRVVEIELDRLGVDDVSQRRALQRALVYIHASIAHVEQQIDDLTVEPAFAGHWHAMQTDRSVGRFAKQGEKIGVLATMDDMVIRALADQYLGPRIMPEVDLDEPVEMRVRGRPDIMIMGKVERVLPAGQTQLPSPALSMLAGGSIEVDPESQQGEQAKEPFFEIEITAMDARQARILAGQRLVVRFRLADKPIAVQVYRSIRQVFQARRWM